MILNNSELSVSVREEASLLCLEQTPQTSARSEEPASELWLEQLHLCSGLFQFMNFLETCITKPGPGLSKAGLIVTGNDREEASAVDAELTEVICRLKHQV